LFAKVETPESQVHCQNMPITFKNNSETFWGPECPWCRVGGDRSGIGNGWEEMRK